jgi:small nuclear ribonucleoprotein (snRNP)-like protein
MEVCLQLTADASKFTNSTFFQTLNEDVVEKDPHNIKGDISIYAYIFSPPSIDFEKILTYWNVGSYYDLKIDVLKEKIIEHMDIKMARTPGLFEQLITIHHRTCKTLPIKQLFKNTTNIVEIYKYFKQNKSLSHIAFIYNEMFEQRQDNTNPNDNLFEVFNIFTNSNAYGIDKFNHQCHQNKIDFMQKFNKLTFGLIDCTFDWSNVVCGGGFVLESISLDELNRDTDIDLFLYGSDDDKIAKAQKLCEYFYAKAHELSTIAWFGQNSSVITICFESINRTVQIVYTNCTRIEKIITDFDIYCNSVLYDGNEVQGIKKWFDAIETKVTKHNPMHLIKNKRLYKTIMKGFQFNKNYHLNTSYLDYVSSGQAEKDIISSHYYPSNSCSEDIDTKIENMCKCYHTSSFTSNMIKPNDLKEYGKISINEYFESKIIDTLFDHNDIVLHHVTINNTNINIRTRNDENDDDDRMIIMSTGYYPCQFIHASGCGGCAKSFDANNQPTHFHDYYNHESLISIEEEFIEKYNYLCEIIKSYFERHNIHIVDRIYHKDFIKFSSNAKIILNDKPTTIGAMHQIYKNGFADPSDIPFVRIKFSVKSYKNNCLIVRCFCAEFKYNANKDLSFDND